jgi:serine/threonine protein kinase
MMGTQIHGVQKSGNQIYSALPLLNSGDLTNLIKNTVKKIPLRERIHILLELSDQLVFMHSKTKGLDGSLFSGYIHSDLKTDNVMLSNEGVALSAYLIDFGLSYSWMSKDAKVLPQGSPLYLPPEIFQPTNQNPKDIPKIDIYSLTAIFAKLLGIKNPVKEKYKHGKYNYTAVAKTPFSLDEAFSIPEIHNKPVAQERVRAFLKRMGSFKPEDRPSSEEVLMFSKSLYNYSTSMELLEILNKPHQTITESIDDLLVAKGLYTKDYLGKVTENITPFMEAPSKLKEVLIYDILMEKTKEDDLSVITKRTVKLLKAKHPKIGALIKGIKGGSNEQYKKTVL